MRNLVILRKMIELCTFRQMVFFIFLLVSTSIIFLTLENYFATSKKTTHVAPTASPGSDVNSSCWETEEYVIKQECIPCTNFEKVSGHVAACTATGFKEVISCSKQGDVVRSCSRVPWLEERNFLIFEICMICSGVASGVAVVLQQNRLEKQMVARIQKQIAAEF